MTCAGRNSLLMLALAVSLVVNVLLGISARNCYIERKLAAVEPVFTHHFSEQNAAVNVTGDHPLVVLVGDSRIAQWNPPPHLDGYDLVNRGIGGETTAQMIHRFDTDVLALKPKVVVIQSGINDLVAAGLASPAAAARYRDNVVANLSGVADRAKSAGITVILLTIILPAEPGVLRRLVWSDRIPALVLEVNRKLALLDAPPRVHVVDSQRVLQTAAGAWKPDVMRDTLHLGSAGYLELDKALEAILMPH